MVITQKSHWDGAKELAVYHYFGDNFAGISCHMETSHFAAERSEL
jgi:hypothetical protein